MSTADTSSMTTRLVEPAPASNGGKSNKNKFSEEVDEVEFYEKIAYCHSPARQLAFWFFMLITAGWVGILALWFPRLWFPLTKRRCSQTELEYADCFLIRHPKGYTNVYVNKDSNSPYFEYQCLRYVYDKSVNDFILPTDIPWDTRFGIGTGGLSVFEYDRRRRAFGANILDVQLPSVASSFFVEILQPFYVYTLLACLLWIYDDYAFYGIVVILLTILSAATSVWDTRRNLLSIKAMVAKETSVQVLRGGDWHTVPSGELVPGDIVEVQERRPVAADLVLLAGGEAVIDESHLTGESIPIRKFPLPAATGMPSIAFSASTASGTAALASEEYYSALQSEKKHALAAGTSVIKVSPRSTSPGPFEADARMTQITHGRVIAVVQRTGFFSQKGQLIRKILHPVPISFDLETHTVIFLFILFAEALAALFVSLYFWDSDEYGAVQSAVLGLEMITIVIPVIIPFILTSAVIAAARRLRRFGVYCIMPHRIAVSGKIHVVCFDKTGTLTVDGVEPIGVREVDYAVSPHIFKPELTPVVSASSMAVSAMATCHSAVALGDGEVVGHPIDVAMFRATHWRIDDSGPAGTVVSAPHHLALSGGGTHHMPQQFLISKVYDFDHTLARMSVIAEDRGTARRFVFTKGSPEVVAALCGTTQPADYGDVIRHYSRRGYYVLALAFRELEPVLNTAGAVAVPTREQAEAGLHMIGLLVFENSLKEDTAATLAILKRGNVRSLMLTGDNPFTAVTVARQCGMVDATKRCFLGDIDRMGRIVWTDADSDLPNQEVQLQFAAASDDSSIRVVDTASSQTWLPHEVELAMTGGCFQAYFTSSLSTNHDRTLEKLLPNTRVFARMKPHQKAQLVRLLAARGLVVGMVGDGSNDTAALRAAHAGMALSEAEASVVSPFTSRNKSIAAMVTLLTEGRGVLATSVAAFEAVVLSYSVAVTLAVMICYYFRLDFSEFMYVAQDVVLVFPLCTALVTPNPTPQISPKRPPSRLFAQKFMLSLLGLSAVIVAALLGAIFFLQQQDFYNRSSGYDLEDPETLRLYSEATVMFIVSNFLLVGIVLTLSLGNEFTRPFFFNPLLTVLICISFFLCFYVDVTPDSYTSKLLLLYSLPTTFRWKLFLYCLCFIVAMVVWEKLLVPVIHRVLKAARGISKKVRYSL